MSAGVPLYNNPPLQKSLPGWQFTSKNPPHPGAARAGRIFTGKLSAGENLIEAILIMGTFYGVGDILIRKDISNPWLSFPGRIFHERDILMWHRQCSQCLCSTGVARLQRLRCSFPWRLKDALRCARMRTVSASVACMYLLSVMLAKLAVRGCGVAACASESSIDWSRLRFALRQQDVDILRRLRDRGI